jgi:Homeodomain-like domain
MAVLSMSDRELRRLEVLRDVDRGDLPVHAAAQLLGGSERQVWRLLKAFRAEGAAVLAGCVRLTVMPDVRQNLWYGQEQASPKRQGPLTYATCPVPRRNLGEAFQRVGS